MMKETDLVVRREDLLAAKDDEDSTVMMDVLSGKYYQLTGPGGDIWENIEKRIQVSDLIKLLAEKYQCTEEVCGPDILKFLDELVEKGLATVTHEA